MPEAIDPRSKLQEERKKLKDKKAQEETQELPHVEEIKLDIASDSEFGGSPGNQNASLLKAETQGLA